MDNTIIIERGIPNHLLTYWMGVLVGLGVDYRLNKGSQLYMALNERRRERTLKIDVNEGKLVLERITPEDVHILSGENQNDTKVTVKVIYGT